MDEREEILMLARLILKNRANGYQPQPEDAARLAELVVKYLGLGD